MSLLPSEPDTSAAEEPDPRVIGVDSEEADDVLSALTAETGREILAELHEDPAPPAELADRVDTSLQNAQYHLNKLEQAGAIEVVDTAYSEKGREMDIYAPADRPLVIFAGDEEQSSGLRAALSRLLSSLGIIAVASLAVQQAFGDGLGSLLPGASTGDGGAGDGGDFDAQSGEPLATRNATGTETSTPTSGGEDVGAMDVQTATETAAEATGTAEPAATEAPATQTPAPGTTEYATRTVTETTAGGDLLPQLPPGVLFFLGGVTALAVVAGVWYLSS